MEAFKWFFKAEDKEDTPTTNIDGQRSEEGNATRPATLRLFKYLPAGRNGRWESISENAEVNFYDANEDANQRGPEWHVEVDGAQDTLDVCIHEQFEFNQAELRSTFVDDNGAIWALNFPTAVALSKFSQRYSKCLFENTYGVEQSQEQELKIFGASFMPLMGAETDASRKQWMDDMDIDKPAPEELATTPQKSKVAVESEDIIRSVVMGAGANSFLMRDSGIEVMKNVAGGVRDAGVSFQFTPPSKSLASASQHTPVSGLMGKGTSLSTPGSALTPSKAMLMDRETRMNVLTPGSTSMYHASIETGKIINEFSFQKDGVAIPMRDIVPDTRAAQLESHHTFLALDNNRLARLDTRTEAGVVQEMMSPAALGYVTGKDYARGTNFACMATSGDGFVVVGSQDGKIRLYSEKTLTQAKTAIPGLGAPITAVDVTYDGKWILATTKSYLMVMKTTYKDGDSGKELCGFTSKMGANAPAPRLLRLRPADVARTGGAPMAKGHFTWITERGRQERWIVASCGNFTVLWNFRSVKIAQPNVTSMGGLTTVTDYHLIPKQQHVVDSVFMHDKYGGTSTGFGDQSAMLVVTDTAVYTAAADSSEEEEDDVRR